MSQRNPKSSIDCYSQTERFFMKRWQKWRAVLLQPICNVLIRHQVTANILTLLAFLSGLLAVFSFYFNWQFIGLIFLALHILLDGLDGPLARQAGQTSLKGSFTDVCSDQSIIALSTGVFILRYDLDPFAGTLYLFSYTLVVSFSMIRNALKTPYICLIRPRLLIYAYFPIEFYLLEGSLKYLFWAANFFLIPQALSGFLVIRRYLAK